MLSSKAKLQPLATTTSLSSSTVSPEIQLEKPKSRTSTFLSKLSWPRNTKPPTWHPNALRPSVLCFSILLSLSLIAILQYLLLRSQHDQGIQFAPKISALPLTRTFLWQYFPIIVAVVFSIFWAWIDLETKRLEPYYQLSKKEGALGKDSLLLRYPFDFVPLVPISAAKARHWPVFWASLTVVLVTWGIVPSQAGVFSTSTVTRTFPSSFKVSTNFIPGSEQESKLTTRYAQSTYAIVLLNETLPPYTTRDYTLAPFKSSDASSQFEGLWTAPTTLYSLDMQCEEATLSKAPVFDSVLYSGLGCTYGSGLMPFGNNSIGTTPQGSSDNVTAGFRTVKEFSARYVGYSNRNGNADYSLEGFCGDNSTHVFLASWVTNKEKEADPIKTSTNIYCQPFYYSQQVNATVDVATKRPLDVVALGPKQQLAPEIFNATVMESQQNGGLTVVNVRGDSLPNLSLPTYRDQVASTNLSVWDGTDIQPMAALAAFAGGLPFSKYIDSKALGESYEKAYRLLFVSSMVDVLGNHFAQSKQVDGQRYWSSEAVVLEPVFTYIIEALLGVVTIATMALLYLSVTRERNLRADPSTIASVMSLVADNQSLLSDLQNMDCCKMEDIEERLCLGRYKLVNDEFGTGIIEIDQAVTIGSPLLAQRQDTPKDIAKPVRPLEFRLVIAIPFVGLFILLAISLAVLFIKARPNGLPLPSKHKIVQNILENYIPTAIATLIEPMWVLINRLLCMLQPLEELQTCKAPAKRSINLNYGSLPPQLVVFKALRSGHFILAAVCSMALLANLLAIAFSGLFNQGSREMWSTTSFSPPYESKFVSINGSVTPETGQNTPSMASGAYHGGQGQDQYLIAESNYTTGTPFPAWTDEQMMYLPFVSTAKNDTMDRKYQARTKAFGAELDCEQLSFGSSYYANLTTSGPSNETNMYFNMSISSDSTTSRCFGLNPVRHGPSDRQVLLGLNPCSNGASAAEFVTQLIPRQNATQEENDICMGSIVMGWIRVPDGSCGGIRDRNLDGKNSLFVRCRPRLVTGNAQVLVDGTGHLLEKPHVSITEHKADELQQYFSNDPVNIIGQSNAYLFPNSITLLHNDTFASDAMNYFIGRQSNSARLVDPDQSVPTLDEVYDSLRATYSRLYAIWLGANKENLLVRAEGAQLALIPGWKIETTQRLFLSTIMFAIAEGIICTYAMVAVFVYLRRPGKYLARLPTCIASVIALFAASAAIQDMKQTSTYDSKERQQHLQKLGSRYGYGSYVGSDGKVHIGIEKAPFVRVRSKSTWFEKKVKSFRNESGV